MRWWATTAIEPAESEATSKDDPKLSKPKKIAFLLPNIFCRLLRGEVVSRNSQGPGLEFTIQLYTEKSNKTRINLSVNNDEVFVDPPAIPENLRQGRPGNCRKWIAIAISLASLFVTSTMSESISSLQIREERECFPIMARSKRRH